MTEHPRGAYPPYVEAMAHAIGDVLVTRGSTYEAAIATLRALHELNYALIYTGPINDPIDYTALFDYSDDEDASDDSGAQS